MAEPPRPPAASDPHAWVDTWIAPPHREGTRKLLDVLGSVADASPYLTRVKHLVVDGPLRDELGVSLYDETAWGVIRWPRAIGRPSTPTLAVGFSIVHEFCLCVTDKVTGRTIGDWTSAGDARIWDGPDDEETHAVSFMLYGMPGWTNRVIVRLALGVIWQPIEKPWMTQRQRAITYPSSLDHGEFEISRGGAPVDLGVFEVVRSW
jgi:hypothetical protein